MIFMKDMIPELRESLESASVEHHNIPLHIAGKIATHNTPMLIAISAPIFSLLKIVAFQTIFQGSRASAISVAPEYTRFDILR